MGNILVLTDFSEGSFRAAEYALFLAKKGRNNLLIFHSLMAVPVVPYDTSGQWIEPQAVVRFDVESRQRLLEFGQRIELECLKDDSQIFEPAVLTELGEGNLGSDVKELISKNDVELVVMGATDKTTLGRLLTGNKIGQVIEKSTKPVLIVPEGTRPGKLKKATFAVNFDNTEIRAFHHLAHFSELFNFDIDVIHVIIAGEDADNDKKKAFLEKLSNGNNIVRADYQTITGKNVWPRLYQQCKANGCDLLAVTHHQYNFLQRLFYKSTTREAVYNLKLPLLIFPSK
ncbi:MAG: universal stress protein [Bacteroidetes bacterium]|nr:universal stress protein [Bacteroidota bacterium]